MINIHFSLKPGPKIRHGIFSYHLEVTVDWGVDGEVYFLCSIDAIKFVNHKYFTFTFIAALVGTCKYCIHTLQTTS